MQGIKNYLRSKTLIEHNNSLMSADGLRTGKEHRRVRRKGMKKKKRYV